MEIIVCKNAGACFGVNRAVDMLDGLLAKGKKVCTLGPLLHNKRFMKELTEKGVRVIDDPSEAQPGECVLIRSHGVPEATVEQLTTLGLEFYDATCPCVARIHKLVSGIPKEDILLVAGDASHPEVIGILGHTACEAHTFGALSELEGLISKNSNFVEKTIWCVAQTTFSVSEWKKGEEILKKHYTNLKIFDTICSTTRLRQAEAKEVASVCDLVFVIGDRESSNTTKLFEVCNAITKTIRVENPDEISRVPDCRRIGITAGASTPVKNIMEVVHKMDENKEILQGQEEVGKAKTEAKSEEFDFETELEESYKRLSKSDTIKGIVTAVYPGEVAVDIGRKHAGYIPLDELTNDPNAKTSDLVKVGDELTLMVLKTNDVDGTVMMSKKRVDANENWVKILEAKDSGAVLEGTVVENVGGGVIVTYEGVRVFIPASHTGIPREGNLDDLLKKTVKFIIIDIDERGRRKRAVGSIRKASTSNRKELTEKFWETAKVGDVIVGKVRSVAQFGVFVNLNGPDGLVHRTELSWNRFKNVEDVVTVGQDLKVMIKELDPEKKRISLTAKFSEDDPFNKLLAQYKVGDTAKVTITSLVTYGAFATVVPGIEGLIHISNIANRVIVKPSDVLKRGEEVDAKIIDINTDSKKVSLSIRALLPEEKDEANAQTVATTTPAVPAAANETSAELTPAVTAEPAVDSAAVDETPKPKRTTKKKAVDTPEKAE
ncbi:MAG TPA: bifunctional 4-hydroxy-3-methylbut-2-enyl diphosphate reductase/30S ribosomal protein S1 [Oscillospiraceae bacterium]|nr:bifunctional 4-hydroxy-3-methylbut-2-enyl diphosphate reductase/30S ribosomal protein S1 [Oscillospiraceae bacterium]HPS35421.1 bifunctional 4-hydroxy-3-methylbut-2-enyl diphosphate reductase/30S ribosomal protein S1 [Oscillospiraceae bacterium]